MPPIRKAKAFWTSILVRSVSMEASISFQAFAPFLVPVRMPVKVSANLLEIELRIDWVSFAIDCRNDSWLPSAPMTLLDFRNELTPA